MAFRKKKKRRKNKNGYLSKISESLEEETKHGVLSIIFLALAIFLALSPFEFAGVAGSKTYEILGKIFGAGFYMLPILFLALAISFFKRERPNIVTANTVGGFLFIVSGLGLIAIIWEGKGGLVGKIISSPLLEFFDFYISLVFLITLFVIGFLVIFNVGLKLPGLPFKKKEEQVDIEVEKEEEYEEDEEGEEYEEDEEEETEEKPLKKLLNLGTNKNGDEPQISTNFGKIGRFTPPPLSLLEKDRGKPGYGDIKANANIIKRTLLNFGIEVEIDEVSVGPTITRYAVKPAEGVRLSRIVALHNDLSLALAAHPIRIDAPIPGKSLVGIEIPNSQKSIVGLASLLSAKTFKEEEAALLISLGRSVTGTPIFGNLSKAPHMLIAGATGAGKSVSIHSLITSLLYRNPPETLRFIMVDPKRVELTLYNDIPHLLTPVITNAKKCVLALKWAIKEMDRRYDILESEQTRDIKAYHETILSPELKKLKGGGDPESLPEAMPYIVIVIDELADIMTSYPKEFESAVVRLAQMSRAVGIHLVLSTQRPSVNIITGLIKANIPSRIAFQVPSQIDSRTILDMAGAEKLLGSGDMLYLSGEMSKPIRLQSAFISEGEVKRVVKFLKKAYEDDLSVGLNLEDDSDNNIMRVSLEDEHEALDDDLYDDARDLVRRTGQASTSYLQRKLGVGYARAARLMDALEEQGVVSQQDGSKRREVLESSPDDYTTQEEDVSVEEEDEY